MKASTYHLWNMQGEKILGGTTYCNASLNDAGKKVSDALDVKVLQSGRLTFMYKEKPVWVYLAISPEYSDKGKEVLAEYERQQDELRVRSESEGEEIHVITQDMTVAGVREAIDNYRKAKK